MKVSELIEELQKMDGEKRVAIFDDEDEVWDIADVLIMPTKVKRIWGLDKLFIIPKDDDSKVQEEVVIIRDVTQQWLDIGLEGGSERDGEDETGGCREVGGDPESDS